MMKRKLTAGISILGLCLFFAASHGISDEKKNLIIVKDGKSDYQIVIPDKYADKNVEKFLESGAKLLQRCVKDASGAELPIVKEDAADKNKPSIFIGNTAFAKANKIDASKFKGWTCVNIVCGKNIVLAGNDLHGNPGNNSYTGYFLGSVKAVTTFLEQNMGVRFLLPGYNGTEVPPQKNISIAADLNKKISPPFEYCTGRSQEIFYDIANNFFAPVRMKLYGGHSYYSAVPKKVYAETHPEYFALFGGKRIPNDNHLCISNPEVQELVYKEMLKWLDMGYDLVELNETDGYHQCTCENCKKLYGIDDPGEKLWVFHRKLAERLMKDRPGKRVMTLAYGPKVEPPKTFKKFPENMVIELCAYSPEYFEKWKEYSVPAGFTAYVYNWGNYQRVGLTPKRTPAFCEEQIKLFHQNNVRSIYRCGFGELMGMEGPVYYVYGKCLGEPEKANAQLLSDDFYRNAFKEAAGPMKVFYETMYPGLAAYTLMEKNAALPSNPRTVLAFIYQPDILRIMNDNLEKAEKLATNPKVKIRLSLVRKEFEYVKNLASIIHLYNAYSINMNQNNFDQLAVEIDKRQAMIDSFYDKDSKIPPFPAWPEIRLFAGQPKLYVTINSRLTGQLGAPFNWSTALLKKNKILPGSSRKEMKIVRADGTVPLEGSLEEGIWKEAEFQDLNEMQLGALTLRTKFKALYDNENIYFAFSAELPEGVKYTPCGQDGPSWGQECLEVFLDPSGTKEKYYHFIFNPVENSRYDAATGFITDPLNPGYGKHDVSWNPEWEYKNYLSKDTWRAFVKIPFSSMGVKAPSKGNMWYMNIGREHHMDVKGVKKAIEYSLWSPNLETIAFCNSEIFGKIVFE